MTVGDLPGVSASVQTAVKSSGLAPRTSPADAPPAAPLQSRSLTLRSVLLGALFAAVVCGLTPLSDLTVNDTSLVSGFVPLGGVLAVFLLVVGTCCLGSVGVLNCIAPQQEMRR